MRTIATIVLILLSTTAMAAPAKLVRVIDGDTIVAKIRNKEVTLQLTGIDCPEIKQPGGPEAKAFTEKALSSGKFRCSVKGKDKYLRNLATITTPKGRNLNISLVQQGHAWADQKTASKTIKGEELKAKNKKRGIWAGTPQPPWQYRIGKETDKIPSILKGIRLASSSSSNTTANQSATKTVNPSFITASDYDISKDVTQVNGEVRVSGRVSNGPPCNNLKIEVYAQSPEGGIVNLIDMISFSGNGSALYSGEKDSYYKSKEWFISNIFASCAD